METNKEINETKFTAAVMAKELYTMFFEELMTAIKNSMGNFYSAKMHNYNREEAAYYRGKYEAFEEISERLQKEYNLALQPLGNLDDTHKLLEKIRMKKNEIIEKAFPSNEYRGTREYQVLVRAKAGIADGMETFGRDSFLLGIECERAWNNQRMAEKLKALLKECKGPDEFNTEDFADVLKKAFIPKNYINEQEQ